jgi:hypothetical protein
MIAFALAAGYMVVEFVAGFAFNSLALLSDAAHMGTDALGLGMALAAITLAQRPSTSQRTYGLYRLEVLAALANGVLLFGVAPRATPGSPRRSESPASWSARSLAGAVTSVGSRGDSYDNALAETTIGLFKTEIINLRGPWRTPGQVELALADWVDWYNRRRLHSACADLLPAEYEHHLYRQLTAGEPAA